MTKETRLAMAKHYLGLDKKEQEKHAGFKKYVDEFKHDELKGFIAGKGSLDEKKDLAKKVAEAAKKKAEELEKKEPEEPEKKEGDK